MLDEVKPTWLYIKRHSKTGLKYFGCTTKANVIRYKGSGTYWSNHLKKHNTRYVVTDLVIGPYTNKEELQNLALWMSNELDIVNSNEWANLMPEDGMALGTASGYKHTEEWKKQKSEAMKGKPSGRKGKKLDEYCPNPDEARNKLSIAKKGVKQSHEIIERRTSKLRGKPNYKNRGRESPKKGKTNAEIYGEEKAIEISNKITVATKGKTSEKKDKTYTEIYGEEKAIEISNKISITKSGVPNPSASIRQKGIPNPSHSERMKGKEPWNKGKKMDTPYKVNIAKCPYCGKEGRSCNMTRYHFNNCKSKPDIEINIIT